MLNPILICCVLAAAYVLSLHYGSRSRSRNDLAVVRWRMAACFAVCLIAWIPLWLELKTVRKDAEPIWQQLLVCLGLRVRGFVPAAILPVCLTALLYSGPIAMKAIDFWVPTHDAQNGHSASRDIAPRQSRTMVMRDVLVAPLTEEFVFRACMVPLLIHRGFAVKSVVAIAPLFFGVAHLHHLYELVAFQRLSMSRATLQVAGQMLYTTVFGAFATWLLIRTGSLVAPISAHMLCNMFGFPDFDAMAAHRHQPLLSAAIGAGVLLFSILLKPMTMSALYSGPLPVPKAVI